ncbi:DsbA family protein [Klebsiella sp. BIGb0407]|uniref:DsbA family protein n=1 Tax=Klebsiella sp. BIGb0407 TaxID=2940603 RepID=UPI002167FDC2|nr:DsbA family protein [Klebsiella sp. BIGb0407]MCS3433514.1 thiol:disulfide interchange protein DsbA [Klebsiella sp. BIGb0407]
MQKSTLSAAILTLFLFCSGAFAKPYSTLQDPVNDAPEVVEFFSFYCGPCYLFTDTYPVVSAINKVLPEGKTVAQYHVSAMGKLGQELSEAWAIASVMGVTEKVEHPIFIAVQRDKSINTPEDISGIFREAGIDSETYNNAKNSIMVKAFIARQEAMVKAFKVKGTPSIYVMGRYLIDNSAVKATTPEAYVTAYADLVSELLKK